MSVLMPIHVQKRFYCLPRENGEPETKLTKDEFIEVLHERMQEAVAEAEFFLKMKLPGLAELACVEQQFYLHMRNALKPLEKPEMLEILNNINYDQWNAYHSYLDEGFMKFAEFALIRRDACWEIEYLMNFIGSDA